MLRKYFRERKSNAFRSNKSLTLNKGTTDKTDDPKHTNPRINPRTNSKRLENIMTHFTNADFPRDADHSNNNYSYNPEPPSRETDRYIKIISWSDEDNCYVGLCPEVTNAECHGDNEREVFETLCNIVDETVALHRLLGKRLPGAKNISSLRSPLTSDNESQTDRSATSTSSTISPTAHPHQSSLKPRQESPYRYGSTLVSQQNRFLRDCGTRVRIS